LLKFELLKILKIFIYVVKAPIAGVAQIGGIFFDEVNCGVNLNANLLIQD